MSVPKSLFEDNFADSIKKAPKIEIQAKLLPAGFMSWFDLLSRCRPDFDLQHKTSFHLISVASVWIEASMCLRACQRRTSLESNNDIVMLWKFSGIGSSFQTASMESAPFGHLWQTAKESSFPDKGTAVELQSRYSPVCYILRSMG